MKRLDRSFFTSSLLFLFGLGVTKKIVTKPMKAATIIVPIVLDFAMFYLTPKQRQKIGF